MRFRSKQKPIYFAVDQTLIRRHHIIKLSVAFLNMFTLIAVVTASLLTNNNKPAYAASYTWDGGGTTNNWSDCANWSTNTCPVAGDSLTFNATSVKDSTVDPGFGGNIAGLTIQGSGYTGTVTLGRSLTLSSAFNQTVGSTFNAGSHTLTAASTFTIGPGAAFNAGTGRIIFTGGASTIACNNTVFNLVEFQNTAIKTVSAGCNMPLGADPIITNGITLNGTISGTGLLIQSAGNFTLNNGGVLSGFNQLYSKLMTVNGTYDFSALDLFAVNLGLTLNNGANLTAPATGDMSVGVGGGTGFVMNTGSSFTAPGGTFSNQRAFTLNSGTTFIHNNGTITFDGVGSTIACNNAAFNLVTFEHTSGTKIVNSDCSLPLGSDPTITAPLTLNGTLSGNNTLTASNTFTLNSGASLTGFNGLVTNGVFNNSGAVTNLGSYATADFNGAFQLNSGTFIAPSGTMTAASTFTISSGSTFNNNNGTVVFDGAGSTITCNNTTFNHIEFQNTSTKTIEADCTFPLGTDPAIPGSIRLRGTLSGSGILTFTSSLIIETSGTLQGFTGLITGSGLNIGGTSTDLSAYDPVQVLGNFTLSAGVFEAPQELSVGGSFTTSGGIYNHNSGSVDLDGVDQTITGDVTFYNLRKTASAPATLTFTNASTQIVEGGLTLTGTENNLLSLVSSTPGSQWSINSQGQRNLRYLSVQDSNNLNTNAMLAYDSQDLGNNVNWQFLDSPLPDSGTDSTITRSGSLADTGVNVWQLLLIGLGVVGASSLGVLTLKRKI